MNQDWTIQNRSDACTATQQPFAAGEVFHTLLFQEGVGLRREDLCETAFKERPADAPAPFSHWRAKFEPTPAKAPEPLGKQTAEQLLRMYMADPDPKLRNVRYILAVMLERKRTIKEVETARAEDGTLLRVYQFPKTGEALVIPDPQLRLDQIAAVQLEVAELLGAPATAPALAEVEAASEQPAEEPSSDASDSPHSDPSADATPTEPSVPSPSNTVVQQNESIIAESVAENLNLVDSETGS